MGAVYQEYAAVSQNTATKHSAQLKGTEEAKTVRDQGRRAARQRRPLHRDQGGVEQLLYLVDADTKNEARALKLAAMIPTISRRSAERDRGSADRGAVGDAVHPPHLRRGGVLEADPDVEQKMTPSNGTFAEGLRRRKAAGR